MEDIAQQIAGFLRIDVVYGYLVIGVVLGFILARVLKAVGGRRVSSAAGSKTVMVSAERGSVDVEIDWQEYDIDPVTMAEVRNLAGKGNKIEAIKRLRETTGLGLHEAKQIVDALERLRTN